MALSLALHGVAIILLFAIGAAGSATTFEPALFVEFAAPAENADAKEEAMQPTVPTAESPPREAATETVTEPTPPQEARIELPRPKEPPPPDVSKPTVVELAPSEEPPPIRASELKPVELARPEPPKAAPAKPAQARPSPNMTASSAARSVPTQAFGSASESKHAASGFLPAPAVVWEGKPRYRHPPTPAVYPSRAIELNQQGEVLVRVRLDTEGGAVEILLHRSSGHAVLDQAALAAVRGWHFLPALRDSRPVPSWVEIPVRFHLR